MNPIMLYKHQLDIINANPKKCGLFLGTGSGKTRTALLLAEGTTLIICPKTQKEDRNWEREAKILHPDHQEIEVTDNGILHHELTISKETFRRDAYLVRHTDTLIIDEAHTVLGVTPNTRQRKKQTIPKSSQLFEAVEEYIQRTSPSRIYLVTATIMKSPMTVWAAGRLLTPHLFPYNDMKGFYTFRERFYTRLPMPGREVWVPKRTDAAKNELASIVRSLGYVGRLEEFFDVPAQTFKTEYVELTPKQKDRIKDIRLEYPEPIVRVGKQHQVENGVLSGDEFVPSETFPNAKLDKIMDYAVEFPRMVIFARYRAQIEALRSALTKAGYKVLTLTGDTKDRGAVIAEANASTECIFIAQCQISSGWELPDFPVMVFASMDYSFVNYDQALGRIQRANNIKKNLYILLVVKGGVDEAVFKALEEKVDFAERLYAGV